MTSTIKDGRTTTLRAGLALAVFSLALTMSGRLAAQRHDIGFVLDIAGDWFLDRRYSEKVILGQALVRGATIRSGPKNSRARITIVFYDGEALSFRCTSAAECRKNLSLPSLLPSSSRFERVIKAVGVLFRRQPERYYVSALSRGSGAGEELREAVVEIHGNQVDLTSVTSEVTSSRVLLRFARIAPNEENLSNLGEAWVTRVGDRVLVRLDTVKPGLHIVSLLRPVDKRVVSDAWILICPRERLEMYQAAFQESADLSRKWSGDGAGPEGPARTALRLDVARSFLRAYLESLSELRKGC